MNENRFNPRALFLSTDGSLYSDTLICSGLLPAKLGGKPCPFARDKHMPEPLPLRTEDADYHPRKGKNGDLCPPCAELHIGALDQWEEHGRYFLSEELLPLRLFQCKQEFWLVVMGLYDDAPTQLFTDDGAEEERDADADE